MDTEILAKLISENIAEGNGLTKLFYHGTAWKRAVHIIRNGFDPRSEKRTTHGQNATFFTPNYSFALAFMISDELDYGALLEVDLSGYETEIDNDLYAKGNDSVLVRDFISPKAIIGAYKFGHPGGYELPYDVDDFNKSKCIEVIRGSLFSVGDEININMSHRF